MAATSSAIPTTAKKRSRGQRIGLGCAGAIALVLLGMTLAFLAIDTARPSGTPGPEAEALVTRIETALHREGWERTGAVRWTFGPTGARHLWDREREWARVQWDDVEVQVDLDDPRRGIALRGGERVEGDDGARLVREGWERWVNDSFWLIAPFKLRDPGTTRSVAQVDGEGALLVAYASGGATPGDAYLWLLADDGTPRAWRMWVSVLPIGGLEASWDRWITLSTGARIATRHALGPIEMELRDVEGAAQLAELEPGLDPFAALAAE